MGLDHQGTTLVRPVVERIVREMHIAPLPGRFTPNARVAAMNSSVASPSRRETVLSEKEIRCLLQANHADVSLNIYLGIEGYRKALDPLQNCMSLLSLS
jgi:hypothetical protein